MEVDRASGLAGPHAVAVALASAQVDLVAEVDRALGAGVDAGIAAGAQVEVYRVARLPLQLESAQPAGQPGQSTAVHRVAMGLGQRATGAVDQQAEVELVGQHGCGAFGRVSAANHQAAPGRAVAHRAHGLGVGQLGGCDQRGQLRRRGRTVA